MKQTLADCTKPQTFYECELGAERQWEKETCVHSLAKSSQQYDFFSSFSPFFLTVLPLPGKRFYISLQHNFEF